MKKSKLKIYVLGNQLLDFDNRPVKLLPYLKKKFPFINFVLVDPNENFPNKNEKKLIILDTILGIKTPMILTLDDFEKKKKTPLSPHDYDLLFHLLLLKKLRKIEKATIIGLSQKGKKEEVVKVISLAISPLKNERHKTYKDQRRE